mmetsp:Transcript_56/g.86  ORF Transcript_56/g.86 Transcript_56/m.86 type:complete len:98 (+) Transcript_56:172-465(+)
MFSFFNQWVQNQRHPPSTHNQDVDTCMKQRQTIHSSESSVKGRPRSASTKEDRSQSAQAGQSVPSLAKSASVPIYPPMDPAHHLEWGQVRAGKSSNS